MKKETWKISILLITFFITACNQAVQTPKPNVYPKVIYPKKEYKPIAIDAPYYFEMPVYAELKQFKNRQRNDANKVTYWRDLFYPNFNATLHISYASFASLSKLDSLKEDTRRLAFEHAFKADDIQIIGLSLPEKKVYGNIYFIEGNTATNLNFFLTDSNSNFVRGALYFNEKTKPDSILPIFQFVKKDVEHLINTFEWK